MTDFCVFFVPGIPETQGSMIPGRANNGRLFVRNAATAKHKAWRTAVTMIGRSAHKSKQPISDPVNLAVSFGFIRPKSHFKKFGELSTAGLKQPIPRKDLDKLVRAVGDSLVDAGIIKDDKQIAHIFANKNWVQRFEDEGAHITIERIASYDG